MTNLRSKGWVTERDEDQNILACTDRGAAIKVGRAKAKAERQATMKAQVRKEAKVKTCADLLEPADRADD